MLIIIFIVIAMLCIDSLLAWLSIPVLSMDLLLLGLSVVMLVILVKLIPEFKKHTVVGGPGVLPVKKKIGYTVFLLALAMLGIYLALDGFQNPLLIYSSVKGNAHGYSVSILGALISVYCVLGLYAFIASIVKTARHS